jgi:hypothetical protein
LIACTGEGGIVVQSSGRHCADRSGTTRVETSFVIAELSIVTSKIIKKRQLAGKRDLTERLADGGKASEETELMLLDQMLKRDKRVFTRNSPACKAVMILPCKFTSSRFVHGSNRRLSMLEILLSSAEKRRRKGVFRSRDDGSTLKMFELNDLNNSIQS